MPSPSGRYDPAQDAANKIMAKHCVRVPDKSTQDAIRVEIHCVKGEPANSAYFVRVYAGDKLHWFRDKPQTYRCNQDDALLCYAHWSDVYGCRQHGSDIPFFVLEHHWSKPVRTDITTWKG